MEEAQKKHSEDQLNEMKANNPVLAKLESITQGGDVDEEALARL